MLSDVPVWHSKMSYWSWMTGLDGRIRKVPRHWDWSDIFNRTQEEEEKRDSGFYLFVYRDPGAGMVRERQYEGWKMQKKAHNLYSYLL